MVPSLGCACIEEEEREQEEEFRVLRKRVERGSGADQLMSDTSSNSGRHKRQASWRSNPLISKFNQKIDSLKEKIPRGRGSRQLDSELSLSEEVVIPTGKRVLSFAERSKDVLSALDEGYFSKEFDPLTWELAQLPSSVGQEELDVVVDKLASALEVKDMGLGCAQNQGSMGLSHRECVLFGWMQMEQAFLI